MKKNNSQEKTGFSRTQARNPEQSAFDFNFPSILHLDWEKVAGTLLLVDSVRLGGDTSFPENGSWCSGKNRRKNPVLGMLSSFSEDLNVISLFLFFHIAKPAESTKHHLTDKTSLGRHLSLAHDDANSDFSTETKGCVS